MFEPTASPRIFGLAPGADFPAQLVDGVLAREDLGLDGFLCPGHASVVIGPEPYAPLADDLGLEGIELFSKFPGHLQHTSGKAIQKIKEYPCKKIGL